MSLKTRRNVRIKRLSPKREFVAHARVSRLFKFQTLMLSLKRGSNSLYNPPFAQASPFSPRRESLSLHNSPLVQASHLSLRREFQGKSGRSNDTLAWGVTHMIRSHRHISESQASQIEMTDNSGLRPKDFHEFVSKQAGAIDILGYTKKDGKNYLRTKRIQSLRYGEVGVLLMYFQCQNENPSFFYDFQMDVEDQITNIF
ncbi:hypothetical protein Lal_00035272 [Lupinus albus]|nr:hypothetical protein Lal_00035272 [Lupinus albus]